MSPRMLVRAAIAAAISLTATTASAQSPSSMLIGRATYDEPFKIKRSIPSDWKVEVDVPSHILPKRQERRE
jgi:hypothetical protein